jgi:DnaK suppressor protein
MAKDKPAKPLGKTKDSAPAKPAKEAPKDAKLAKDTKGNGSNEAAKDKAKHNAHPATLGAPNGKPAPVPPVELTPFLERQKERLLQLRDSMLDSMMGVAKDNLRTRAEGSEASAFGMHQADAGSDAYDRDFALSLLSQEQDALYEIEEALKRIDLGAYGVCEMTGKPINHARLEALPFARYTVECQSQIEKQGKVTRARVPVTSLFGLTDEEPAENEEEEPVSDNKE